MLVASYVAHTYGLTVVLVLNIADALVFSHVA